MKNILKLSFVLLAFVLFSCGNKNEEVMVESVAMADMAMGADYVQTKSFAPSANVSTEIPSEEINVERKIIKTGRIEFETADDAKTKELIRKKVSQLGGWISNESSDRYSPGGETRYNLTIRIPAQYFDTLLDSVSANAQKVVFKNISSRDVTEEFIDLEARLATKKDLENRYKELLQKATKVEEMLAIEREMATLRSEIESFEGRYKYLQNQVSFSTLDITYYEKVTKATGFGAKFVDALGAGWDILLAVLIALASLWAIIIIGVVAVIFIVKRRRKKRK
ncbi:MAG: DUF4349 domain-containing protein [Prevotellaceae bacterium]|jgi:hypothetical protein|nr:DUF4349 domain-containing protein [Prevotellaceae bacterium]